MKKLTKAQDTAYDKKHGIKEGSKKDKLIDRLHGVKDRKLSYKEKSKLPKKTFAIKTKSGYGGKGKYPIPDASHARNALARVHQFGSPSEIKRVEAAVHSKFPGIGKSKKRKEPERGETKAHEKGESKAFEKKEHGKRKTKKRVAGNPFGNLRSDKQVGAGQPFRQAMLHNSGRSGLASNKIDTGRTLLKKAMRKLAKHG